MSIKLEVGKRYELNNGDVHVCEADTRTGYAIGPYWYAEDGTCGRQCDQLNVRRCLDDEPTAATWQDMARELIEAYRLRFDACVADYALDDAMGCVANVKALEAFIREQSSA